VTLHLDEVIHLHVEEVALFAYLVLHVEVVEVDVIYI
jgi:hypothetical protein